MRKKIHPAPHIPCRRFSIFPELLPHRQTALSRSVCRDPLHIFHLSTLCPMNLHSPPMTCVSSSFLTIPASDTRVLSTKMYRVFSRCLALDTAASRTEIGAAFYNRRARSSPAASPPHRAFPQRYSSLFSSSLGTGLRTLIASVLPAFRSSSILSALQTSCSYGCRERLNNDTLLLHSRSLQPHADTVMGNCNKFLFPYQPRKAFSSTSLPDRVVTLLALVHLARIC